MFSNFSNFGSSSFGSSQNQNQGFQRQYQPIGNVQSFYGQGGGQGNQAYGQSTFSGAYHTANYRGNQQGHDARLRADSVNPAQQGSGYGYGNMNMNQSGFSNQASSYGQQTSPQSFHTANYRGNQQGHDVGLRADSMNPAQQSGGYSYGNMNTNMNQSGFSNQASSYGQQTSPESFHTANYRGNQQGHDVGLRADSMNPAQHGGSYSGTNYNSFAYGVRGHENANSGQNNVSSQFGFSPSPYSSTQNQNF